MKISGSIYMIDKKQSYIILALTVIVCYGNTYFNGYALDDNLVVTENKYVQKGVTGIADLLTHPYYQDADKTYDYRPVASITLAIEHQFFGNNPHISHLVNLLLYTLCIWLVFVVLCEVFALDKIHGLLPLFITYFYAIHPSHTEVVASIKNREELFSVIFALAALLYAYRFFNTGKWAVGLLTIFFLLLSLVSKMTSMTMLGVIILVGLYYGFHKKGKGFYILTAILTIVAIFYFRIIWSISDRPIYFHENPLSFIHDVSIRVGTSMESMLFYFKFMLWPYPFCFYYGHNTIPPISIFHIVSLSSILLHVSLFVFATRLWLKGNIAGLFIYAYLGSIFAYSNLPLIYTGIVSERSLFLPSLWFILSAGVILYYGYRKFASLLLNGVVKKTGMFLIGALSIVFIWLTIQRNFQWKDNLTLMGADIVHMEHSTLGNFFYAWILQDAGEASQERQMRAHYFDLAKKHYRQTFAISPDYAQALFRIGMIHQYEESNSDSAFYYFQQGFAIDTSYLPLQFQLAKSYYLKGEFLNSDTLFADLYHKMPSDTSTLFFYAKSLYDLGRKDKAMKVNRELLQLDSGGYLAYLNFGEFYLKQGDSQQAVLNLEEAIKRGCRETDVLNYLLKHYFNTQQNDKAAALQTLFAQQHR